MDVQLVEVTDDNVRAVCDLGLAPGQERMVAPNAVSLAEAYVSLDNAWPRAVEADGELVGFVQLWVNPGAESGKDFYLWRLMVAADHQRRGIGHRVLDLVVDEVRRRDGTELYVSWVPETGGPGPLYERYGFTPTGEVDDGEVVAVLHLDRSPDKDT